MQASFSVLRISCGSCVCCGPVTWFRPQCKHSIMAYQYADIADAILCFFGCCLLYAVCAPWKQTCACLKMEPRLSLTERRGCDGELVELFWYSQKGCHSNLESSFKKRTDYQRALLLRQSAEMLLSASLISYFFTTTSFSFSLIFHSEFWDKWFYKLFVHCNVW